MANIFGQSLSSISRGSQHPDFLRIKDRYTPPALDGDDMAEYNLPFTAEEYDNAIKLSYDGAVGEDGFGLQMITHLPDVTVSFLLSLFNRIWTSHQFPASWLCAIILMFQKPGRDPFVDQNYRPISLTSCICKVVERMVNTRLVWALEVRRFIISSQYGFCHGRSTVDVLAQLDTDIKVAFTRKEHTFVVFFDLQKAYDTTWRACIVQNLLSAGVGGRLLHFINNFLTNRTMKVRIGSILSRPYVQHEGVPQGSVLSCTLFQ